MEQIINYIKPELIVVAVVLYMIHMGLKKIRILNEKYIPLILCGIGLALCAVWVFANCPVSTGQEAAMAIFTTVIQGVLVTGVSVYLRKFIDQTKKKK